MALGFIRKRWSLVTHKLKSPVNYYSRGLEIYMRGVGKSVTVTISASFFTPRQSALVSSPRGSACPAVVLLAAQDAVPQRLRKSAAVTCCVCLSA
jgi:hypothetical protein